MPKFLVVHPVGEVTLEDVTPVAKAGKAKCTGDAYWIKSWYAREIGKIYCEWDGKDAETIRQLFAKELPEFPVEGIYKIEWMIDAEDFR